MFLECTNSNFPIFRFPKPSRKSEVQTRFFFYKISECHSQNTRTTRTTILRLYRLFTTLSYYGENGRNPNKPLSKIARRRRRQLDPSRCSWNVQTLTFHFYKIQISKSLWKSEVQTRFLFYNFHFVHSQNDILRMTFLDYIDYSLPCLIIGNIA